MQIQHQPPVHLTYYLNIHPGETWAEQFTAIQQKALKVKELIAPDRPFGLGLRLSRQAADSLAAKNRRTDVRKFLDDHGLYAFTINGFPYGQFHGARVKENVYAPDWRTSERREYTLLLADILADLLPDGVSGSISTVPVSFRPWIANESDLKAAVANLSACADHLAGGNICLALEPEPGCFLETTEETIRFLTEQFPDTARQHIGVCFDTCHVAVQFEDVTASMKRYLDAGVRVAKIQLSAAIETDRLDALEPFRDEVYLHQTKLRRADGSLTGWNDLPSDGPLGERALPQTFRTHFHVPLFFEGDATRRSTAATLTPEFFHLLRDGACEHLEIETYTFDVLPPELGLKDDVIRCIAEEFNWVLQRFG